MFEREALILQNQIVYGSLDGRLIRTGQAGSCRMIFIELLQISCTFLQPPSYINFCENFFWKEESTNK